MTPRVVNGYVISDRTPLSLEMLDGVIKVYDLVNKTTNRVYTVKEYAERRGEPRAGDLRPSNWHFYLRCSCGRAVCSETDAVQLLQPEPATSGQRSDADTPRPAA